jgi:hypothetical protein
MGNEPLAPGKFLWDEKAASAGPVLVAVNLDEQDGLRLSQRRAHRPQHREHRQGGQDTPIGVFTILQKNKDHRSKKYKQRTDALHATADLGRHRAARRQPSRLSGLARLRSPALRVLQASVRRHHHRRPPW